ncbi:MAG: hypothetical protein ABII88_04350 [Candidatus Omnitrophota bacterium]
MKKGIFFLLAGVLSLGIAGKAMALEGELPSVRAYVDKAEITIGEKIKYTLEVDYNKSAKAEFPIIDVEMGGFAIKDFGQEPPRKTGRKSLQEKRWYLLDTYTVGSYVIPQQQIKIILADKQIKKITAPEVFVEVKSVLGQEGQAEGLRDIKSPVSVAADTTRLILVLLGSLLLIAGIMIFWRFCSFRSSRPVLWAALPAHEQAFRELERINSLNLLNEGKIKEYYYLVSNCLRSYLENRFGLRAPEQTTEEFLAEVIATDQLKGRDINRLKEYLQHCDLVKYAKFEPGKSDIEKLMTTTRQFVEETKLVGSPQSIVDE